MPFFPSIVNFSPTSPHEICPGQPCSQRESFPGRPPHTTPPRASGRAAHHFPPRRSKVPVHRPGERRRRRGPPVRATNSPPPAPPLILPRRAAHALPSPWQSVRGPHLHPWVVWGCQIWCEMGLGILWLRPPLQRRSAHPFPPPHARLDPPAAASHSSKVRSSGRSNNRSSTGSCRSPSWSFSSSRFF
jgi:hypothetical protein